MSTFVLNNLNRRCHRAGSSTTSYAGAMTSLIFCVLAGSLFLNLIISSSVYAASTLDVTVTSNISVDIAPLTGGIFATSDTTTSTISIKTDHYTGYTLGIMASSDNNALINTTDNSKTIPSISSPVSESDYRSFSTLNNTWGYRPSKYHSLANNNYLPVPTDTVNSDVLDQTSIANPTDANNYNIALGTRLDNTVATGSYAKTLIFTIVVNPTPYTITYNQNTADPVADMPANITDGSTYSETITLSTNIPTRNNYHFTGWCTVQEEDDTNCSGTQYNAGGNYTLDQTSANNLNLYAMWNEGPPPLSPSDCPAESICYAPNSKDQEGSMSFVGALSATTAGGSQTAAPNSSVVLTASNYKRDGYGYAGWSTSYNATPDIDTIYGPNEVISTDPNNGGADISVNGLVLYPVWVAANASNMQGWTGCSSMAIGGIIALTDSRDGNVYAVSKLVDGKCWMIENLRLADKNSSNNNIILSSTNTHNPSLPLTNSDGTSTSNSLSAPIDPYTTAWCASDSSVCGNKSMLATNNIAKFVDNTSSSPSGDIYGYGNYYNWYSATAGHGKYGANYGSSYTAPGDICPTGWHIPTGGSATAEIGNLDKAMGGTGAYQNALVASDRWRAYPNNFTYSGYLYGSYIDARGSAGHYWSSSAQSSNQAWRLSFSNSGVVYPATGSVSKHSGRTVRCLSNL